LKKFLIIELIIICLLLALNIQNLENTLLLLIIDLSLIYFFYKKIIINRKLVIFISLSIIYFSLFYFEYIFHINKQNAWAFLSTMNSLGLDSERDVSKYIILSLIFRNVLCLGLIVFQNNKPYIEVVSPNSLLSAALIFIPLSYFSPPAICIIALRIIIIAIFIELTNIINSKIKSSFFLLFMILPIIIYFSSLVTRSRLELTVILIYICLLISSNIKKKYLPFLGIFFIILGIFSTNLYGYLRTDGAVIEGLHNSKFLIEGEVGNINILGSTLIGSYDRKILPYSLNTSLLDKINTLLPGFSNKKILADIFMSEMLPNITEGGFAYSLIAELYILNGVICILIFGFILGIVLSKISIDNSLGFTVFTIICLQLFRQEFAITLLTLVAYILIKFFIYSLNQIQFNKSTKSKVIH